MAKKNKVEIDVVVDDKGSTKKVGVEAKKAAKGLDNVDTSSRNAQKGIKGVAQTASAGSKNFAGMSRGMGGLVGAYASFAAQMFALTAAFGFFKRAGDLSVMQQGQVAYASATGIAMRSLANDITAATGAQITFRDASQAAAIGTAAGLSADQLTRLGTAAKDASAVLGRDVTDAFNRLVRGVTKAEPELLDELGIILRLDTASENYARSLGKVAGDLTQFEKSQAVANEVLSQAETKYSAILAVTGGGAVNQFAKLGKSMDDVVMTIQNALLPVANVLAKVLGDTPILAAAGFALLVAGPLKAMGFSLKDSAVAQKAAAKASVAAYAQRKQDILETTKSINLEKVAIQQKAQATIKAEGYTGNSKVLKNVAATGIITPQARASIKKGLNAVNLDVKESTVIQKGMFKGLTVGVVKDYEAMVSRLDVLEKAKAAGTVTNVQRMKLAWGGLTTGIARAGAGITAFASSALAAFGWISIGVTVFLALREALTITPELTAVEEALERQKKKVVELNKEYKHFLEIQKIMTKEGTGMQGINSSGAVGSLLSSLNVEQTLALMDQLDSYNKKAAKSGMDVAIANLEAAESAGASTEALFALKESVYEKSGRKGSWFSWLPGFQQPAAAIQDAEKAAKAFATLQINAVKDLEKTFGKNPIFLTYTSILETGGTEEAIKAAKSDVDELTSVYNSYITTVSAAADATANFNNSLVPMNVAETAIAKQEEAIAKANKVMKNNPLLGGPNNKGTDVSYAQDKSWMAFDPNPAYYKARDDKDDAIAEIKRIDQINESQQKRKRLLNEANLILKKAKDIEHPLYKARLLAFAQEGIAQQKRLNKEDEIRILKLEIGKDEKGVAKTATRAQARKLKDLNSELTLAVQDEVLAERAIVLNESLFDAKKNQYMAKEAHYAKGIDKRILAFEQQSLDIIKRKAAIQKAISKDRIDELVREQEGPGGILQDREGITAKLRAKAAREELDKKETGTIAIINKEFDAKIKMAELEGEMNALKWELLSYELEIKRIDAENIRQAFLLQAKKLSDQADAAMVPVQGSYIGLMQDTPDSSRLRTSAEEARTSAGEGSSNIATLTALETKVKSLIALSPTQTEALVTILGAEQLEALRQAGVLVENLEDKARKLEPVQVMLKDLGQSVHDNMAGAFTALVTGAKSAKAAFADMAVSILKDLAAMIVKMAILNMFKNTGFGNFIGLGARSGGVFDQGKKMSGYATGGIAKGSTSGYPVMMHGTEAVVPLPNGNSIPVQMSGNGGGSTNNIVVNISTEGQSSKQGSSGPDMDKLGGAVAAAVQVELQNQKRSGGILNPYGAA